MTNDLYNYAEQPAPIYSIVGGQHSLVGKIVSLNTKATSYFGVGDIELNSGRYYATVSKGMPSEYYEVLEKSLKAGTIVLGRVQINPIDRNEDTLKEWYKAVDLEGGRTPNMISAFKGLIAARVDKNYSLGEIVRYCLAEERKGKNREEVLAFLKEVNMYVDFKDKQLEYNPEVYEDEEGKVDVTLVNTSDGLQVLKTGPGYESPTPRSPEGDARVSEVLDSVFGSD